MYTLQNKIRIVTAASLFDGHDAAINIMRRIMQAKGEVREEGGMGIMRVDEATAKAVLAFHGPKVFLNEIPA